jgi:hypothetical protein
MPPVPQPIKQKRYPWSFSTEKRMTIAAGFWHRNGVLLCSDSQQEGGSTKIYGPKIGFFECPGGKIGIAFAGNVRLALSAIDHCSSRLKSVPPSDTVAELDAELETCYRRAVFSHPLYGKDEALGYSLLISFWDRGRQASSMFVTQEHTMSACYDRFQAIGIGFELANVLARPFAFDEMEEEEVLALAAYVLAQVKENVPGCGGISQFIAMRNDGAVSPRLSIVTEQIEDIAARYDKAAHRLLFSMIGSGDMAFNEAMLEFGNTARDLKDAWRKARDSNPEVSRYLLLTKDVPSRPQPSPEPPARSDES